MKRKKVTIHHLLKMKEEGRKITKVNLYDYPTAVLADQADIDIVMIGDSVGTVVLGYDSTIPVTMEDMIHHAKAVSRGAKYPFIICDMPFMSYQINVEEAVRNAGRLMQEGGIDAVKLEGGVELKETVKAIVGAGIPVVSHIGLQPQKFFLVGKYKYYGRDAYTGRMVIEDAKTLEEAGACMVILECVASEAAKKISETLRVPVIGAGSGPHCDGQSMNIYDILGLSIKLVPNFAKQYLNLKEKTVELLKKYKEEVHKGEFPAEEHTMHMDKGELEKLEQ